MRRFFIRLLLIITLIGLVLHFTGRALIKQAIISYFFATTGFKVAIEEVWIDLKNDTIVLEDFIVINPSGFTERVFCDLERLKIQFDYRRFFSSETPRDIIFPEIQFHAQRFVVEKRIDGVTNLSLLKGLKPIKSKLSPTKKRREFLIARFELSIRQIGYIDHTKETGKYQVFNINVENKVFKNINKPGLLRKIMVMEVIKRTTLDKISLGIDTDKISKDLASLLDNEITFGSDTITKGMEVSEDFFSEVKKYAPKTVQKATDSTIEVTKEVAEIGVEASKTVLEGISDIGKGVIEVSKKIAQSKKEE
ncbi:hypothetical protein ACFL3D_01160 [Candidatus Omnitrophota bacterium]